MTVGTTTVYETCRTTLMTFQLLSFAEVMHAAMGVTKSPTSAALMQWATGSDPAEEPILLHVDREGGHGQGKPMSVRVQEVADRWAFIFWQTGICE